MISDRKAVDEEAMVVHTADDEAIVADIGASGTLADVIDIPTSDTISTYVVQSGDTVTKVAKRFGVSENTIRWANNMSKKDVLHVGQTLAVLPITGVKHKVQKGDTLETIAKKYKADKADIMDFNDINEDGTVVVGDILIIPDGEITAVTTSAGKTTKVTTGSAVTKSGVSATKGYYIRPVTPDGGRIRKTQGFHTRYNAVDVGAPVGTPIHAMADGVVIVTKSPKAYNGGYGGLTIISHANGSQTLYAHQSRIIVSSGDRVTQGQVIGYTGNTGKSTGPHLHFEIRGVYPTPVLY
jgi:murein DD-endopeptidase MepM/ murein hydrolase activator NlpD